MCFLKSGSGARQGGGQLGLPEHAAFDKEDKWRKATVVTLRWPLLGEPPSLGFEPSSALTRLSELRPRFYVRPTTEKYHDRSDPTTKSLVADRKETAMHCHELLLLELLLRLELFRVTE